MIASQIFRMVQECLNSETLNMTTVYREQIDD